MIVIDRFNEWLNALDSKKFYQYVGIFFGTLLVIISLAVFYHIRSVNSLQRRITDINELREEAKKVFGKAKTVNQQRAAVNTMPPAIKSCL